VILAISPLHASAEAEKCPAGAGGIVNFLPTDPPRPVPEKPFFDAKGAPRTIADYRGKGVVLNFWATWCGPCVREMPSLDRLAAKIAADGILVLTLSEDRKGAKVIEPFYDKLGIVDLPVLIDKRGLMSREMSVRALPTTVLVDPEGIEKGRVVGAEEWDTPAAVAFLRHCIGGAS